MDSTAKWAFAPENGRWRSGVEIETRVTAAVATAVCREALRKQRTCRVEMPVALTLKVDGKTYVRPSTPRAKQRRTHQWKCSVPNWYSFVRNRELHSCMATVACNGRFSDDPPTRMV